MGTIKRAQWKRKGTRAAPKHETWTEVGQPCTSKAQQEVQNHCKPGPGASLSVSSQNLKKKQNQNAAEKQAET